MTFEPYEIEYLTAADVGRLATVQSDGTVQVSPVGFGYNAELGTVDVAGYRMSRSQKFRNLASNPRVAFVVDDVASRDPWRVRCLEIRGLGAQVRTARGDGTVNDDQDDWIIRITPRRIISFGIDDLDTPVHQLKAYARDV